MFHSPQQVHVSSPARHHANLRSVGQRVILRRKKRVGGEGLVRYRYLTLALPVKAIQVLSERPLLPVNSNERVGNNSRSKWWNFIRQCRRFRRLAPELHASEREQIFAAIYSEHIEQTCWDIRVPVGSSQLSRVLHNCSRPNGSTSGGSPLHIRRMMAVIWPQAWTTSAGAVSRPTPLTHSDALRRTFAGRLARAHNQLPTGYTYARQGPTHLSWWSCRTSAGSCSWDPPKFLPQSMFPGLWGCGGTAGECLHMFMRSIGIILKNVNIFLPFLHS